MEQNAETIRNAIAGSLNIIEQDREREIISRRFGLEGQKETLEQIGDMLSITRERVRQLEKAILIRLRIGSEEGQIPELAAAENASRAEACERSSTELMRDAVEALAQFRRQAGPVFMARSQAVAEAEAEKGMLNAG